MNIYGRPRYLSRYSNSWRAGWTEDQIPVGGRDFPCPSRPAPRSTLPLLQCLPGLFWGLSGRGVVFTTHHFLATRLQIGWSLTSAFPLRLHSHVVVWHLHIYYLFIYGLFQACEIPNKLQTKFQIVSFSYATTQNATHPSYFLFVSFSVYKISGMWNTACVYF